MVPDPRPGKPALTLSVIVPFHRDLACLERCLGAIRRAGAALPPEVVLEALIVAADGAIDDPVPTINRHQARLLSLPVSQGPAVARTRAADLATGDVLVFVDADVVVHDDSLARLASHFIADKSLGAAFGAYDETPADRGFFSQCRNLAHSFIHQQSNRDATTFWAGLGAVRAAVFAEVGGFDPRFAHPSVEDIDLGYRISRAGFRIALDATAQGTHLKRWTLWRSIVSDVRDRGVPWTQLINRYGALRNDLNLTHKYRWAVVMAYLIVMCLAGAIWSPLLLIPVAPLLTGLWFMDRAYYAFFIRKRGVVFALAWFPFHVVHHLCNGVSFATGTALYLGRRWSGIVLPWTLPITPWSPRGTR